jgi:hypothetical protein
MRSFNSTVYKEANSAIEWLANFELTYISRLINFFKALQPQLQKKKKKKTNKKDGAKRIKI